MPAGQKEVGFDVGTEDGNDGDRKALFCEMLELRPGQSVWRETARWVKFEEDVEEDGNRWSKPFVASLSMHAVMELRNCLAKGSIQLGATAQSLNEVWGMLADDWVNMKLIPGTLHEAVVATLSQPIRHQHQMGGFLAPKKGGDDRAASPMKRSQSADPESGPQTPSILTTQPSMASTIDDLAAADGKLSTNKRFFKKLPPGCESAAILVGELEFIRKPLYGFVQLANPIQLKNLVEVPTPTRYVFVALAPRAKGGRFIREVGRTMGTLFSDALFQHEAVSVRDRDDLLNAVDNFLGCTTVLPPGEWNPTIRIEPPTNVQSQENRMQQKHLREGVLQEVPEIPHEAHGSDIRRTGRICGGLIDDIKRKSKWYLHDFKDALHIQSIASIIFLYFASMTPLVTFGGLMSKMLHKRMGAIETIMGRAISGVFWGFTAGQPIVILGSTGPILVFETITYELCQLMDIEYLNFRVWIGFWSTLFLLIMVIFDLSFLVGYITRFTEESFAALVSAIFVYESIKKLLHIAEERPVQTHPDRNPQIAHLCFCNVTRDHPNAIFTGNNLIVNATQKYFKFEVSTFNLHDMEIALPFNGSYFSKDDCTKLNFTLTGIGCDKPFYEPNAFLLSVCLFFGTFIMSRMLKAFKFAPCFPTLVRQTVSDFAVIISIFTFVMIDYLLGIDTPKLEVPDKFEPTYYGRQGEWIVPLFGNKNAWWTALLAAVPGLLATILIFMDQQITTVIVSRKENKLRHGVGYHLDLLMTAILIALLSWIGMPWMIADTVLSLTHSSSLRMESDVAAPGERPTFLGIREQRVTNIIISVLIGVSIFLTKFLQMIPMPVLFGVFLFMGSNALLGLQFTDRLKLVLMPLKYQPDYVYLRHVKISRVHLFTLIQLLCLALLWVLKSFQETAMLFPVMVGALVGVRKLLDYIFTQKELSYLDDLMPESTKRRKEDRRKSQDVQFFKPNAEGVMHIPLPNGNVLTVPMSEMERRVSTAIRPNFSSQIQDTQLWKNISTEEIDRDGKNGPHAVRWSTPTSPGTAETKKLLP
ncbi:sodium bicarbonate cotransporter 3-like [Paramacrobiotus metropolitanus]|uniref:sodium bicarbonate cotransporter 3-like n=1 Tax=Paramacrobiotus metropolitanus TaxID=2943436 RepID=UPI002445CE98|nr:sodium bicarbonate cotransporter 3-like [Paramacrobiotus metropolitanus]